MYLFTSSACYKRLVSMHFNLVGPVEHQVARGALVLLQRPEDAFTELQQILLFVFHVRWHLSHRFFVLTVFRQCPYSHPDSVGWCSLSFPFVAQCLGYSRPSKSFSNRKGRTRSYLEGSQGENHCDDIISIRSKSTFYHLEVRSSGSKIPSRLWF